MTKAEWVAARKVWLLGLVVVLALGVLTLAGCGGGGESDQGAMTALQGSLGKISATMADLTAKGTSGSLTVADIKAARDSLKPEIQSVIDNGKKVKGADVSAFETAWAALDAAVTALPDSASLVDIGTVLISKVSPLQAELDKIGALVSPTST
ncbi:MAG: hypothetical protein M1380_10130 [Chloroflexi bacterium]|nr:hypothetical protein [Chloroflexota bacterium]MCL5734957.1 hypothetical protein [Actinomycetota bacterium]